MAFSKRELDQQFSTFADLSNGFSWQELPRLRRSMEQKLDTRASSGQNPSPASDANFWVAYWHHRWTPNSQGLPKAHLYAYLQEPGYWNAYDLSRRFQTLHCDVEDCFQAAMFKIDEVLEKFDPERRVSLATYANQAFGNAIRDALGRYDSLNVCSDLSLLRKTSQKFLKEALELGGASDSVTATHVAALLSFQAIYFPCSRKVRNLEHLTPEQWTAIAREYSKLKRSQAGSAMGGETELKAWLRNCVKSLRCYKSPSFKSLNSPSLISDQEWLDQLPDELQVAPMERLELEEAERCRKTLHQQVNQVLSETVDGLKPSDQALLQLCFCEGLKQADIAQRLGIDQSKVSRRLASVRQVLLTQLMVWSREELHISRNPPVPKDMSLLLQNWLTLQFSGERKEHVAA